MAELRERLQAALGDAYRLERELGGGGMSRVFLATEQSLNRQVVVKVLPPEFASDISAARFKQEIEVAAHLQHPNILPVLAAGARDGIIYYIMPYVAGESLRQRLSREGKLPVADAARVLHEVADALAYAHGHGVIHRDIKPENILLEENHAVLADFGVARALAQARSGTPLTESGVSVGTPGYMSPEQAAGERHIDARADVYAMAVVGYEMLAGAPPFEGPTAQAVLAAHLSKPPKPLRDVRPDTPPALAGAIAKALAKAPGERFHSAAEFRDALDAAVLRVGPAAGRRTAHLVAGGVLVAVLAIAALLVARSRGHASLDANLVAVTPFDVLDPRLELWREGMVDVLSRNLDGAGPLRTVSPTIVVRRWRGRADPASAAALGRRTGARLAVYGQLVATRGDSVRLTAGVLDVATTRPLAEIEVRDQSESMDRLADSLTVALLRELGRTRPIGAVRRGSFGAAPLPALKAFLQGEQYFRRTDWDSAVAYYERAVALDSTFPLPYWRMSTALGWQRIGGDSLSTVYAFRAGALNHGLAPRDSLLLVAESLSAVMYAYDGDTAWHAHARRLFATLRTAAERYADDPEVWYALGDAHFHFGYGPAVGSTWKEKLDAFERAIALDSAFAPSYLHAAEIASWERGLDAARRYLERYLALQPTDVEADGRRLAYALLDPTRADAPETGRILDTASGDLLFNASQVFRRTPDSAERGVQLARLLAAGRRGDIPFVSDTVAWSRRLGVHLAYRGHLQEAARTLTPRHAQAFAELALLGGVPPEIAARAFARYPATEQYFALPWWAARGNTVAIGAVARRADSLARAGATPAVRQRGRYTTAAIPAYLALARGDSGEALRRFEALPDTLCIGCYAEWVVRARLLSAAGRDQDAAALLERLLPTPLSPLEVPWALERARVNERLGNREKALANYRFVVEVWRNADPELGPLVDEARVAIRRLTGERGRG